DAGLCPGGARAPAGGRGGASRRSGEARAQRAPSPHGRARPAGPDAPARDREARPGSARACGALDSLTCRQEKPVTPKTMLFAVLSMSSLTLAAPATPGSSQVKRGEYLVSFGGCHDCHTPKKMGPKGPELDRDRLLAGHPEQMAVSPAPALQ